MNALTQPDKIHLLNDACQKKDWDACSLIIEHLDHTDIEPFMHAALSENIEYLNLFIPHYSSDIARGLHSATFHGKTKGVTTLLPYVDKKTCNSMLTTAAYTGRVEILKIILPFANPKHNKSYALRFAVEIGGQQCIDVLYKVSSPMVALKQLKADWPHLIPSITSRIEEFEQRIVQDEECKATAKAIKKGVKEATQGRTFKKTSKAKM